MSFDRERPIGACCPEDACKATRRNVTPMGTRRPDEAMRRLVTGSAQEAQRSKKTVPKTSFSVPQARLARPATPGPGSPVDAAQTPFFIQKHEDEGRIKSVIGALR